MGMGASEFTERGNLFLISALEDNANLEKLDEKLKNHHKASP